MSENEYSDSDNKSDLDMSESENDEENQENDEEFKNQFEFSYKDFERVGFGIQHHGSEQTKNPLDRFKNTVSIICNMLKIDETVLQDQINKDNSTVNFKYKYINPTAFVLGFIASNKGIKMTKKSVNDTFLSIEDLTQELKDGIEKPDIIRYARYWINVLNV